MEAAGRLDVDLVVASDRPNVMAGEFPDHLLTLPFDDPGGGGARGARVRARARPLDAVVPVDDVTTVVGAAIAERLGLRCNPAGAVRGRRATSCGMRERLAAAGVPAPAVHRLRGDRGPARGGPRACAIPACSSRSCSRRAAA